VITCTQYRFFHVKCPKHSTIPDFSLSKSNTCASLEAAPAKEAPSWTLITIITGRNWSKLPCRTWAPPSSCHLWPRGRNTPRNIYSIGNTLAQIRLLNDIITFPPRFYLRLCSKSLRFASRSTLPSAPDAPPHLPRLLPRSGWSSSPFLSFSQIGSSFLLLDFSFPLGCVPAALMDLIGWKVKGKRIEIIWQIVTSLLNEKLPLLRCFWRTFWARWALGTFQNEVLLTCLLCLDKVVLLPLSLSLGKAAFPLTQQSNEAKSKWGK